MPADFREFIRDYHNYSFWTDETNIRARNGDLFCDWRHNGWTHPRFSRYFQWMSGLKPHYGDLAPPNLRWIADDENCTILLAVDGGTRGSIFFSDPTTNDGSYAHVTLLAHSFEHFFFSLELTDQEESHPGPQQERWPRPEKFPAVPKQGTPFDAQMSEARYAYVLLGEESKTANEADLERVEQALSVTLPPDYRQFLKHYGACGVGDFVFYSTSPDDRYDIVMQWNRQQDEDANMLPIAGGMNETEPIAWLVLQGEEAGSIKVRGSKFDSFTDFLNSCV